MDDGAIYQSVNACGRMSTYSSNTLNRSKAVSSANGVGMNIYDANFIKEGIADKRIRDAPGHSCWTLGHNSIDLWVINITNVIYSASFHQTREGRNKKIRSSST